jgi:hypothetical protein
VTQSFQDFARPFMSIEPSSLFTSLFWSSIGVGFFVYGKKQRSGLPLAGGLLMIGISYFIESPIYLSLSCVGLVVGMYWIHKQSG